MLGVMMAADEQGYRLEYVGGLGTWEFHPFLIHQNAVDRVRASIRPVGASRAGCACVHKADIYVRFPDGSVKRPDVAIFCAEPQELTEPVTMVPEAVVEIISRGSEKKDVEVGVPFYLAQGVKDVVLLDPYAHEVTHHHADGLRHHASPVRLRLECGCECEV
jgi:Uma2 family endonuclease